MNVTETPRKCFTIEGLKRAERILRSHFERDAEEDEKWVWFVKYVAYADRQQKELVRRLNEVDTDVRLGAVKDFEDGAQHLMAQSLKHLSLAGRNLQQFKANMDTNDHALAQLVEYGFRLLNEQRNNLKKLAKEIEKKLEDVQKELERL